MSQDNFDLIGEVPETQTPFRQFGKLTITNTFKVWREGKPEEVSVEDWKRLPQKDTSGKSAKSMDINFNVDIQELNSALGFSYDRKVQVHGADWNKILVKSIEEVLGKGAMSKEKESATLRSLNGKYVQVVDVPQVARKNAAPDAKQYNTISFVAVYGSREECHAAYQAMRGSTNGTEASAAPDANTPSGWGASDWLGMKGELADAVSVALAKAASDNASKPAPVKTRAMESAKQSVLSTKASEWGVTAEQTAKLLEA